MPITIWLILLYILEGEDIEPLFISDENTFTFLHIQCMSTDNLFLDVIEFSVKVTSIIVIVKTSQDWLT